jgi:S-adenosylmethionine hydrolase
LLRQLICNDLSFKDQPLKPANVIPKFPEGVIGYIDSFGNIKTTFQDSSPGMDRYRPGQRVRVIIGGIIRTATVATGSFNVMEGDLAFAPGSSGHSHRFWEFFQRGGSAWTEFSRPPAGTQIIVEH